MDKKTEINFLGYWEGKNFTGYAAESILANDNECTYKREYFKMKYRVIEFVESNKKRGSVIIERMAPRQAGIVAMKQVLKKLQDYEKYFKNKTSAFETSAAVKHKLKYKEYLELLDKDSDSFKNTYLRFRAKHTIERRQETDRSDPILVEKDYVTYCEISKEFKSIYDNSKKRFGPGFRNTIQAAFKYAEHISNLKEMCGDAKILSDDNFKMAWKLFRAAKRNQVRDKGEQNGYSKKIEKGFRFFLMKNEISAKILLACVKCEEADIKQEDEELKRRKQAKEKQEKKQEEKEKKEKKQKKNKKKNKKKKKKKKKIRKKTSLLL